MTCKITINNNFSKKKEMKERKKEKERTRITRT